VEEGETNNLINAKSLIFLKIKYHNFVNET